MEKSLQNLEIQVGETQTKLKEEEKKLATLDGGIQILRQVLQAAALRDKGVQV